MASYVIGGKDEGLIKGFLEYENKDYSFSYENRVLHIYPPDKNTLFDSRGQILDMIGKTVDTANFIGHFFLKGSTATGKSIMFDVSEQYSNINGFLSFDVYVVYIYSSTRIKKPYPMIPNEEFETISNKIKGIIIKGREIDYFYNPAVAYQSKQNINKSSGFAISIKEDTEKQCGRVLFNDNEAELSVRCRSNYKLQASTPFTSYSIMVIQFKKEVTIEDIKTFYIAIIRCLSYLCRRTNINLDEVEVFDTDDNENSYRFGTYYYLQNNDIVETNEKASQRIIDCEFLDEKFGDLLQVFLNNEIYIDNLPSNINNCNSLKADRIILDFVVFEREFDNLYPQAETRSEQYIEIKNNILKSLDKYIDELSGKNKKYAKEIRRVVEKCGNSLGDNIKKALLDNEKALCPFLINFYGQQYRQKIEAICTRLNTIRNDTVHGNLEITYEPGDVFCFIILECLIYSMRLKHIGMEDKKIQQAICKLMGFNIHIPESADDDN